MQDIAPVPREREAIAAASYLELARVINLESAATDEIKVTDAIRTLDEEVRKFRVRS